MECASSQRSLFIGCGSRVYLGFEGDDFEHHLNGEKASEDHVEDVHGIVKGSSLLIVLWGNQMGTEPKTDTHPTRRHIVPDLSSDMWGHGNTVSNTVFALLVCPYGHRKARFLIPRVPWLAASLKKKIVISLKYARITAWFNFLSFFYFQVGIVAL